MSLTETDPLIVGPRSAKLVDGLHPFQSEFNQAISDSSNQVIIVEAPVGSGKSHIARTLVEDSQDDGRIIVLTFPTKILMEAQIASLRQNLVTKGKDLCVWPHPDDSFREGAINLLNYSTDAMLRLAKKERPEKLLAQPRGELIETLLFKLKTVGSEANAVVTTPDVLHLIAKKRYKSANGIASYFAGGHIFVFDEFHLYHNLSNFRSLVQTIIEDWKGRIVLLSATPVVHQEVSELIRDYRVENIGFDSSEAHDGHQAETRKFNHEIAVSIENFRTSNLDQWIDHLQPYVGKLETPMAIILDSVHRVQRLKTRLEALFGASHLKEWTGIRKDPFELTDQTVVVGTSAIEVGLNLPFKSLVFEATFWPSAIQRLGRVGRLCDGAVVIFSRQRMFDAIGNRTTWSRQEFECEVLMPALRDPDANLIGGEMFRGDSHAFLLVDRETGTPIYYDQSVFSMFTIDDYDDHWMTYEVGEKASLLRRWGLAKSMTDEILLRDQIVPFCGVLRGLLRQDYVRLTGIAEDDESLTINANQAYVFWKPAANEFIVDLDDLFSDLA